MYSPAPPKEKKTRTPWFTRSTRAPQPRAQEKDSVRTADRSASYRDVIVVVTDWSASVAAAKSPGQKPDSGPDLHD
jgi:hypothetical protein